MSPWATKGMLSRVKTTHYPDRIDSSDGMTPGRPSDTALRNNVINFGCPTSAIEETASGVSVDFRRCVHCFHCARPADVALPWTTDYEWAKKINTTNSPWKENRLAFRHSISVLVVDSGDCGACLSELKQLSKPYYNFHRLGYFVTPTPRHADVLLVVGPVTDNMRLPLLRAYEGIPEPRKVVAIGACALMGGVFGPSFTSSAGVADLIPVNVEVAGCPPPPAAILHALNVATGRDQHTSEFEAKPTGLDHVGQ
ncbi:MAG TPA: hypothetical protein VMM58_01625 [Bacteroidota bacterium]|nr:hypothetical protein [Bacteroidota bacterium]